MKKSFIRIMLILYIMTAFIFTGCESKMDKDKFQVKKIEISRVILGNGEDFDTGNMKIERTWTFNDIQRMKVIFKESVIGNLEPRTGKHLGNEYDTYYVRITFNDNSIEEWLFWLDKSFNKDGAAENKANKGEYKLLDKKDVVEIGKLLKD